jgi:sulfatase modifying factor 1
VSRRRSVEAATVAIVALVPLLASGAPTADRAPCPEGMVVLSDRACIDAFEAHLERLDQSGNPSGVHPANEAVLGKRVRAQSKRGVVPQAYLSQEEAAAACREANKRLCTNEEWLAGCKGPLASRYPYGARRHAGACNDRGAEPIATTLKRPASNETWGFDPMNDPRLHLVPGGVARTGRFDRCRSEIGTHDMVGNVHEWTADPEGTLRGGFYLDTADLGEGCDYAAIGHDTKYRDYSTGFRCCADRP